MKSLIAIGMILFSLTSWGKVFETSYLTIELPNDWNCLRNSTIWICRGPSGNKADAIIYMTAKASSTAQDMGQFYASIMEPRTITGSNNLPIQSKVFEAKKIDINGAQWTRAFHLNSEIENFYTYYMATHNSNLAVFVSINIYKPSYEKYKDMLSKAMYSLKLKTVQIKPHQKQANQWQTFDQGAEPENKKSNIKKYMAIGLIVSAIALVAFVLKK